MVPWIDMRTLMEESSPRAFAGIGIAARSKECATGTVVAPAKLVEIPHTATKYSNHAAEMLLTQQLLPGVPLPPGVPSSCSSHTGCNRGLIRGPLSISL